MTWKYAENVNIIKEEHHRIYGAEWSMGLTQYKYLEKIGLNPKQKVCDLGCGVGRLGIHLLSELDRGNYVGIDGSKTSLDIFKKYELPMNHIEWDVPLLHRDLTKNINIGESTPTGGFDLIIAFSVFNHMKKHKSALEFINETLKENGTLITTFAPPENFSNYNLSLVKKEKTLSIYGNKNIEWFQFKRKNI